MKIKNYIPNRYFIDKIIDQLRFKIDTIGGLDYQPLPWLGLEWAGRSAGMESRWEVIRPLLIDVGVRSALDIGCNVGWFSINLARLSIPTIGMEVVPKFYRSFLYAVNRLQLSNVGLLIMKISLESSLLLPQTDCTLFLSVWHHTVKEYGLDAATSILQNIWNNTGKIIFFETGEEEMPASYNLPKFDPDPQTWLSHYLLNSCPNIDVIHLGVHLAFDPNGKTCKRNLFAGIRKA